MGDLVSFAKSKEKLTNKALLKVRQHLEEHDPHFCIMDVNGDTHILPDALLKKMVLGDVPIQDHDLPWLRRILKEWYEEYLGDNISLECDK